MTERKIDAISIGIGADISGLRASLAAAKSEVERWTAPSKAVNVYIKPIFGTPGGTEDAKVKRDVDAAVKRFQRAVNKIRADVDTGLEFRATFIPVTESIENLRTKAQEVMDQQAKEGHAITVPVAADIASASAIHNTIQNAVNKKGAITVRIKFVGDLPGEPGGGDTGKGGGDGTKKGKKPKRGGGGDAAAEPVPDTSPTVVATVPPAKRKSGKAKAPVPGAVISAPEKGAASTVATPPAEPAPTPGATPAGPVIATGRKRPSQLGTDTPHPDAGGAGSFAANLTPEHLESEAMAKMYQHLEDQGVQWAIPPGREMEWQLARQTGRPFKGAAIAGFRPGSEFEKNPEKFKEQVTDVLERRETGRRVGNVGQPVGKGKRFRESGMTGAATRLGQVDRAPQSISELVQLAENLSARIFNERDYEANNPAYDVSKDVSPEMRQSFDTAAAMLAPYQAVINEMQSKAAKGELSDADLEDLSNLLRGDPSRVKVTSPSGRRVKFRNYPVTFGEGENAQTTKVGPLLEAMFDHVPSLSEGVDLFRTRGVRDPGTGKVVQPSQYFGVVSGKKGVTWTDPDTGENRERVSPAALAMIGGWRSMIGSREEEGGGVRAILRGDERRKAAKAAKARRRQEIGWYKKLDAIPDEQQRLATLREIAPDITPKEDDAALSFLRGRMKIQREGGWAPNPRAMQLGGNIPRASLGMDMIHGVYRRLQNSGQVGYVEDAMREFFPNAEIDLSDTLAGQVAPMAVRSERLAKDWPYSAHTLRGIRAMDIKEMMLRRKEPFESVAGIGGFYTTDPNDPLYKTISLNRQQLQDDPSESRSLHLWASRSGFHAPSWRGPEDVISHELAHHRDMEHGWAVTDLAEEGNLPWTSRYGNEAPIEHAAEALQHFDRTGDVVRPQWVREPDLAPDLLDPKTGEIVTYEKMLQRREMEDRAVSKLRGIQLSDYDMWSRIRNPRQQDVVDSFFPKRQLGGGVDDPFTDDNPFADWEDPWANLPEHKGSWRGRKHKPWRRLKPSGQLPPEAQAAAKQYRSQINRFSNILNEEGWYDDRDLWGGDERPIPIRGRPQKAFRRQNLAKWVGLNPFSHKTPGGGDLESDANADRWADLADDWHEAKASGEDLDSPVTQYGAADRILRRARKAEITNPPIPAPKEPGFFTRQKLLNEVVERGPHALGMSGGLEALTMQGEALDLNPPDEVWPSGRSVWPGSTQLSIIRGGEEAKTPDDYGVFNPFELDVLGTSEAPFQQWNRNQLGGFVGMRKGGKIARARRVADYVAGISSSRQTGYRAEEIRGTAQGRYEAMKAAEILGSMRPQGVSTMGDLFQNMAEVAPGQVLTTDEDWADVYNSYRDIPDIFANMLDKSGTYDADQLSPQLWELQRRPNARPRGRQGRVLGSLSPEHFSKFRGIRGAYARLDLDQRLSQGAFAPPEEPGFSTRAQSEKQLQEMLRGPRFSLYDSESDQHVTALGQHEAFSPLVQRGIPTPRASDPNVFVRDPDVASYEGFMDSVVGAINDLRGDDPTSTAGYDWKKDLRTPEFDFGDYSRNQLGGRTRQLGGGLGVWFRGGTSRYRDLWTPGGGLPEEVGEGPMATIGSGLYLTDEINAQRYARIRADQVGGEPVVGSAEITLDPKDVLDLTKTKNAIPPDIAKEWAELLFKEEMEANALRTSGDGISGWLKEALAIEARQATESMLSPDKRPWRGMYEFQKRMNDPLASYRQPGSYLHDSIHGFQTKFSEFLSSKGFGGLLAGEGGEFDPESQLFNDHPSLVVFDPKRHVVPTQKRALGGGIERIGVGGQHLWDAPGPGWIIPHHLIDKMPVRKDGGKTPKNRYLVGEAGDELYVPEALGGLIPPKVMAQLPKRAGGGTVEGDDPVATPLSSGPFNFREKPGFFSAASPILSKGTIGGGDIQRVFVTNWPPALSGKGPLMQREKLLVNEQAKAIASKLPEMPSGGFVGAAAGPFTGTAEAPGTTDKRDKKDKKQKSKGAAAGAGKSVKDEKAPTETEGEAKKEKPPVRSKGTLSEQIMRRLNLQGQFILESEIPELRATQTGELGKATPRALTTSFGEASMYTVGGRQEIVSRQRRAAAVTQFTQLIQNQRRSLLLEVQDLEIQRKEMEKGTDEYEENTRQIDARKEAIAEVTKLEDKELVLARDLTKGITTWGSALRAQTANMIGISGGMVVFQAAMSGVQLGMQALSEASAPMIERGTGFTKTTNESTRALGSQVRAMKGAIMAVTSLEEANSGLSARVADMIDPYLKERAIIEGGNEALQEQIKLINISSQLRQQSLQSQTGAATGPFQPAGGVVGVTRATGGWLNTPIGATPSLFETLSQQAGTSGGQNFVRNFMSSFNLGGTPGSVSPASQMFIDLFGANKVRTPEQITSMPLPSIGPRFQQVSTMSAGGFPIPLPGENVGYLPPSTVPGIPSTVGGNWGSFAMDLFNGLGPKEPGPVPSQAERAGPLQGRSMSEQISVLTSPSVWEGMSQSAKDATSQTAAFVTSLEAVRDNAQKGGSAVNFLVKGQKGYTKEVQAQSDAFLLAQGVGEETVKVLHDFGYAMADVQEPTRKLTRADMEQLGKAEQLGATKPDRELMIRQMQEYQIPAFMRNVARQTIFQTQKVQPAQFALNQMANPTLPIAGGIPFAQDPRLAARAVGGQAPMPAQLLTGKGFNATFASDQSQAKMFTKMYGGMTALGTATDYLNQKFEKGKDLIDGWSQNGMDAGLLKDLQSVGAAILQINRDLTQKQTNLTVAEYTNSIRVANRSLKDAKDMWRGINGAIGSSYGMLEGMNIRMSRQLQLLGFELQQRQINFSLATAGFVAPGTTPEERAARIEAAKIEAEYAQKQLDLQRQIAQNQYVQTGTGAQRAVTDLTAQRDLMVMGRALVQESAAAQVALERLTAARDEMMTELNTQMSGYLDISKAALDSIYEIESATGELIGKELEAVAGAWGQAARDYDQKYLKPTIATINTIFKALGMATIAVGQSAGRREHGATQYGAVGMLGQVSSATKMIVGEAGPETVAVLRNPREILAEGLSKAGSGGGGYAPIQVIFNNPVVKDEGDIDDIVRKVESALMRKTTMFGLRRV